MRFNQEWRAMRADHLRIFPECRICGLVEAGNHVHHLRYRGKRGRSERPGDLVTLCRFHHQELHRRHPRGGAGPTQTMAFIRDEGR